MPRISGPVGRVALWDHGPRMLRPGPTTMQRVPHPISGASPRAPAVGVGTAAAIGAVAAITASKSGDAGTTRRPLMKPVGTIRITVRATIPIVERRRLAGGRSPRREVKDATEVKLHRVVEDVFLPQVRRNVGEDALVDRIGVHHLDLRLRNQEPLGSGDGRRIQRSGRHLECRQVGLGGSSIVETFDQALRDEELVRSV